jgi:hypothetical protein
MVNVGQYSGLQHPSKANFVLEHNDNFEWISGWSAIARVCRDVQSGHGTRVAECPLLNIAQPVRV